MLSIKEACRYANFLAKTIEEINDTFKYGSITDLLYTVTETHKKSKVGFVSDEFVIVPRDDFKINCKIEDILFLMKQLIEEKAALANAIDKAKSSTKIDWKEQGEEITIDVAVEMNKNLQTLIGTLKNVSNAKTNIEKRKGTDYKFNNEGNQVSYTYEVETKKEINFDRTIIVDLHKKILNKTDKISSLIELNMLKETVDFTPLFSIHDSLEEVFVKYSSNSSSLI